MKKKNAYLYIVLLMGIFSTMPIITIPLGSRDISLFSILIFLVVFILAFSTIAKRNGKLYINAGLRPLNSWLIWGMFSCLCGVVFFSIIGNPEFTNASKSSIFKLLIFLIFSLLWGSQDDLEKCNTTLSRGLLIGCVANAGWAFWDAIGYYITGKSITNIVFAGYIVRNGIRHESISLTYSAIGLIRSAGFNYDPAHIGFIAPLLVGYGLYNKKLAYVLLGAASIIASASTTALVCSVFVTILFMPYFLKNKKKLNKTEAVWMMIGMIVIIGIIVFFISRFGDTLQYAIGKMEERVGNLYLNNNVSDIRFQYLKFFPKAFLNLGVLMLTGTGFGTASYGYACDSTITSAIGQNINFAFDMENTYLAYALDTGIIGVVLIMMIVKRLLKYLRDNGSIYAQGSNKSFIKCGVVAMMLSMLFYHYTLYAPQMLIIIVGLSSISRNKNTSELKR